MKTRPSAFRAVRVSTLSGGRQMKLGTVTFGKLTQQPATFATGELCQRVFGVEGATRFELGTVFG